MPEIDDFLDTGIIKSAKELNKPYWLKYIWSACETCGKERWVHLVKGKPVNKHCPACAHNQEDNGRWKGGLIERIYLECGKIFYVKPSKLNHERGKFCSKICGILYNRKANIFGQRPNNSEKTFLKLCEDNQFPFKYVGNGEVWLGNRNPDFINTDGKKQVIELLGTYWHPLFDGASRREHYKQYGFDCLVIWEDELGNIEAIAKKVKTFMRQKHAIK